MVAPNTFKSVNEVSLKRFVNVHVPTVSIHKEKVSDIRTDKFDELAKELQKKYFLAGCVAATGVCLAGTAGVITGAAVGGPVGAGVAIGAGTAAAGSLGIAGTLYRVFHCNQKKE